MHYLIFSILNDWFGFPNGSVLTNLVATVIGVAVGYLGALRHLHCQEKKCYRPGIVAVEGTVNKVCKKHALKHGHTH